MQGTRKHLLIALAMLAGGVVAFFVLLAIMGIDPDQRPLGLFEWVLAGVLVGPGFGYLIKWRRMRDAASRTGQP